MTPSAPRGLAAQIDRARSPLARPPIRLASGTLETVVLADIGHARLVKTEFLYGQAAPVRVAYGWVPRP